MERLSLVLSFGIVSFLVPKCLTWAPNPPIRRGFVRDTHFATTNDGYNDYKGSPEIALNKNNLGTDKIISGDISDPMEDGASDHDSLEKKNLNSLANESANQTSFKKGIQEIAPTINQTASEDKSVNDSSSGVTRKKSSYDIGIGKNRPVGIGNVKQSKPQREAGDFWVSLDPVQKPKGKTISEENLEPARLPQKIVQGRAITRKKIVPRSEETKHLKAAVWHEDHFEEKNRIEERLEIETELRSEDNFQTYNPPVPTMLYPRIDLSIPDSVYSESDNVDIVWDNMRYEAFREAEREPLLVSFLHSTILNHNCLESALAFHLANSLSSPAMISTQIQALILEALQNSPDFRKSLRADIMAVRDRDPACNCLPDVFLYFKGFLALQTHRVAHYMYASRRQVLAHYLQSQVSQNFQIDIHPNATIGLGVMMDHGTGIVVGETARIGHNCSILHHVTLGGSGRAGVDRHPKVGDGVLLGAGCSVLGNIKIGDGCQIGAGTLVISDLPPHSVAVGVPAKIIGSFVDVTQQPSIGMNQMTGTSDFDNLTFVGSDI